MGRILILGGTGWLGRSITRAAIAAGHLADEIARGVARPRRAGLSPAEEREVLGD